MKFPDCQHMSGTFHYTSFLLPEHTPAGRYNVITDTLDFSMHLCLQGEIKNKTKGNLTKCELKLLGLILCHCCYFKWGLPRHFAHLGSAISLLLVLNSSLALRHFIAKQIGRGQRGETQTAFGLSVNTAALPLLVFQSPLLDHRDIWLT